MKVLVSLFVLSVCFFTLPLSAQTNCAASLPEKFYSSVRERYPLDVLPEPEAIARLNTYTDFKGDVSQLRLALVQIFHSKNIQTLIAEANVYHEARRWNVDQVRAHALDLQQSRAYLRLKMHIYNQVKSLFGQGNPGGLSLYTVMNTSMKHTTDETLQGFYFRVLKAGEEGPWYSKVQYNVAFDGTVFLNSATGITEVCTVGKCEGFTSDGQVVSIPRVEDGQACLVKKMLSR